MNKVITDFSFVSDTMSITIQSFDAQFYRPIPPLPQPIQRAIVQWVLDAVDDSVFTEVLKEHLTQPE